MAGNPFFAEPLIGEERKDVFHNPALLLWTVHQSHTVRLDSLLGSIRQDRSSRAVRIDGHPPQAEAADAAEAIPELCNSTLPLGNLGRQFTAVLCRHDPFQRFHDRIDRRIRIPKRLAAIDDTHSRSPERVLVIGALVHILEPPPPAYIEDEENAEIRGARDDSLKQRLKSRAMFQIETALARVNECADDFKGIRGSVFADGG